MKLHDYENIGIRNDQDSSRMKEAFAEFIKDMSDFFDGNYGQHRMPFIVFRSVEAPDGLRFTVRHLGHEFQGRFVAYLNEDNGVVGKIILSEQDPHNPAQQIMQASCTISTNGTVSDLARIDEDEPITLNAYRRENIHLVLALAKEAVRLK